MAVTRRCAYCDIVIDPDTAGKTCTYPNYCPFRPVAPEVVSISNKEKVNHPQHYGGDTTYETIKVLEAWLTPEQFHGFLLGNSIKYMSRADKKNNREEDLRKALWYDQYLNTWLKETENGTKRRHGR